jgi:hypothetical protein
MREETHVRAMQPHAQQFGAPLRFSFYPKPGFHNFLSANSDKFSRVLTPSLPASRSATRKFSGERKIGFSHHTSWGKDWIPSRIFAIIAGRF